jgi:diguanylate cyclase (GGDEF)-like protein
MPIISFAGRSMSSVVKRLPLRFGPIQWLILCGCLLVTAMAIGTAFLAMQFRDRALEVSERELANTALLLSRHFDQQLSDLQRVQDDVLDYLRPAGIDTTEAFESQMSSLQVHEMLRTRLNALPHVGGINLFDAKGWLINSSETWPVSDINVSERTYFKAFTSGTNTSDVVVEPALGKVTGVWTTIFARKIVGRNGEIIGFSSRSVDPSHFEKFVASLALGSDTVVSMMHRDGTIIARYPHDASVIGKNLSNTPLFAGILAQNGNASGRFVSPIKGDERLGTVRQLTNYPILIVATTSLSTALADWQSQTKIQIFAAILGVFVILATLFLIVRQLRHQHIGAQSKLSEKTTHLDMAINNMTQGLLLFDGSGRLVVCNAQYLEMFRISPEVAKPGCYLRDLINHRKETGTFVGDVDAYCDMFLNNSQSIAQDTTLDLPDGRLIHIVYKRSADGGWASTLEDVTERRRFEEKIEHLAHYDPLTELPNRTLFRRRAEKMLSTISVGGQLAVLYIDIDDFKGINDTLGHPVGDELLKSIAKRLTDCIGPADFVARLGGDEFAIIQSHFEEHDSVRELIGRVYEALRRPVDCLGHRLTTDASIGVAVAPDHGSTLDVVLKNADLAMYEAKTSGRRTFKLFEPEMEERANSRRELEQDLRLAVAEGGLEIHYQPLVDLGSNQVTGCEALLRWKHSIRGAVSPADFIPLAEETGLIDEIGQWVLKSACAEAMNWPDHVRLAVNVSPVQFKSSSLALHVATALAESGLPAYRLELEITEAVLISDDETALVTLHQLRDLGVHIALDDFGTGYSSLSYIQRFPFDKIKIDRSFVKNIVGEVGSSSIVRAVVSIAADRNMTTTAEGVETEQQRDSVRALGCTQMQGYLFSAARPANEIKLLLSGDISEPRQVA